MTMTTDKIQPTNSQFILYQDDNGVTNVNLRLISGISGINC